MAEKKKWNKVVQKALDMYRDANRGNYAYFYGAKGQVLTDELMHSLVNAYPEYFRTRYTDSQLTDIFNWSRGKIGYDCSGFIAALTGDNTYSTAQFEKCYDKSTDLAAGVCGQLLYKDKGGRHIAIDCGFGMLLDMGVEKQSIRMRRIRESDFQWTGKHPYISYEGSDAR